MDNNSAKIKVSVVLPAYNEGAAVGDIIARIRAVGPNFEIIVVDDASTDETGAVARTAGATVLRNPYNIGNGSSVRRGILASAGDVVVLMDADGQHPPEEIPRLLQQLGDYDMAVASRSKACETSQIRNIGNTVLNTLASFITGHAIADLTSGFRAIKRSALLNYVHLFPHRYSYPTTITMAMLLDARFVFFLPVDTIGRRRDGVSNLSPFLDFIRFVVIMFRVMMLFSPKRIFVPLAGALFVASIVASVWQYIRTGGIHSLGLGLFLTSVIVGFFGLLADQIALIRRR
jgi:glycosyltransferase involved in cell wall biosynthesis